MATQIELDNVDGLIDGRRLYDALTHYFDRFQPKTKTSDVGIAENVTGFCTPKMILL